MTTKPTIQTPSTIVLGVHVGSQSEAAIVGSLRTETGIVQQGVIELVGSLWPTLARACVEAAIVGAVHLVVLTNDASLAAALTKPFPAPTGGEKVKVWNGVRGDGKYVTVDLGNAAHWQVLRWLGLRWPGRFAVQRVAELKNAKALFESVSPTKGTICKAIQGEK